jgi:hypothetical protein
MNSDLSILIIKDISSLITELRKVAFYSLAEHWLTLEEHFEDYADWVISELIVRELSIQVIGHSRHDLYKCCLERDIQCILVYFQSLMCRETTYMLQGYKVKIMVNGRNLFITRRPIFN